MATPAKSTSTLDDQLRAACAALDQSLRAGKITRTEDVLAANPDLAAQTECVLELAYTEFVAREAQGEAVEVAEFLGRFPHHAGDLRELFEVHQFVQQAAIATLARAGEDTQEANSRAVPREPLETDGDERRFGNYALIEELGRGGMGVVYRARQRGVERDVALKLILAGPHAAAETRARFQAEAVAVGRLTHPNIVRIHEVGIEDGRPFLSLELVDGGNLAQKLDGAPANPREAALLVRTLAEAIQYAHSRGVIHRDLKPANILLDASGVPKITDFGLAKQLHEDEVRHTASEAVLGTPCYMAPEQAVGKSRDSGAAVDVYALGAILYELLTGRPPFRGETVLDTLEQVRAQEPVPPRRLVGKLSRDLETICLRCLQKAPAHRYRSAGGLADDLRRFLEHRPIQARPVGVVGRCTRWSKRNPVLATVSALLAVVLCAVTIVSPIVALTQSALRQQVEAQLEEIVRQSRATKSSLLATRSRLAAAEFPQRSVLLAIEGIELHRSAGETPPTMVEQALRDALAGMDGTPLGHQESPLTATCCTPDGRWIVTGGANGAVRLWPASQDKPGESPLTLRDRGAPIRSLSVSSDGIWLLAMSDEPTGQLWDLRDSQREREPQLIRGHDAKLAASTFSPDGGWLFIGDRGGVGRLYRIAKDQPAECVQEITTPEAILDAEFSADGSLLAVAGVDKCAHVWEFRDGKFTAERVLRGHSGFIVALAFDPTRSSRLATASVDRTVRMWDLSNAAADPTCVTLTGHENYVACVTFSRDGKYLFSGSHDRTLRRWNISQADPAANSVVLSGHRDRVYDACVSRDGQWLASGSRDKTVRIWAVDAPDPNASVRVLRGHDDAVQGIAISPDSRWLVSASADGLARRWQLPGNSTSSAAEILSAGAGRIQQVSVSKNGRWLAASLGNQEVWLRDRQRPTSDLRLSGTSYVRWLGFSPDERWLALSPLANTPLPPRLVDLNSVDAHTEPLTLSGNTQSIESLLFDPAGRWIAGGSVLDDGKHPPDGAVRVWALPPGSDTSGRVLARHEGDVTCLAYVAQARLLASGSSDGQVMLSSLDATTKSRLPTLPVHRKGVVGMAALPNHAALLTLDGLGDLRYWSLADGAKSPTSFEFPRGKTPLRIFSLSSNGRWLAAVNELDEVLLWELQRAMVAPPQPRILGGDDQSGRGVVGCVFDDSGRQLAIFGLDGLIRVWRLDRRASDPTPLLLAGHGQQIQTAVFAADGASLVSGGYDGTIREWPLDMDTLLQHARQAVGRALTREERAQFVEQ